MNGRNTYSLDQNDFYIRRTSNRFIINSIVSMLFLYIASLIDTLIVGMYLGEDGLAAMSLVSPVYLIYYMIGATVGIGASVYAGRVLGQGDTDEYRKIFTCATVVLASAALIMTVLGYCFTDGIMKLFCGSVTGVQAEMARQYFLFYIPGGAFTLIAYIPLYFLKVEGKPKAAARFFSLSGIINAVLTWLFMSPVFGMGIKGASLATSISFLTVCSGGLFTLLRGRTELRFVRDCFSWGRTKSIVISGAPTGLSNLLESGRILLVNMLIISLGASSMLTCYTVVRNVADVLNAVVLGIATAIIPMIGVLFGERNYRDLRIVMGRTMKIGLITMGVLTAAVCICAGPICSVFGVTDPEIITEARWAIPLSSGALVLCYVNQLYICYLTTVKREDLASVMVSLKLFVMVAVFALPLSRTAGVRGIWLSLSLAEVSTFIIFCIIRSVIRKRKSSVDRYLLDTSLEQDSDISFAVKNDVGEIVNASEKITGFCEDNGVDMRTSMRVSLAIEEVLAFLLTHCLGEDKENYVAVRICRIDDDLMVRFRYMGEVYNPLDYYQNNADSDELSEELLGLKMIIRTAKKTDYQLTLGLNNIIITF